MSWIVLCLEKCFVHDCGVVNLKIYFLDCVMFREYALTVPKCGKGGTFGNYINKMQTSRKLLRVQPQNVISVS